jgi:hypothetical protein
LEFPDDIRVFVSGTKRIPLPETLPENIACLAFLFVAGDACWLRFYRANLQLHPQTIHSDFHNAARHDCCGNLFHDLVVLGDYKAF